MPDQTFPNQKIVLTILKCIQNFNIVDDDLKESDLVTTLQIYKNGEAGTGYKECQTLVQSLLNNWFRSKNNIQTIYDKEGGFDDGYRILYKQVEKQKRKT
jgi:hypothetical protein|tara:strand:+ start:537 stop:836 length:300 start_codon:yes stop_codon:yes gene_type:complete